MPTTYDAIATTTLGSATQTITFSSIATTWTDLILVLTTPASSVGGTAGTRVNGKTSGYLWYDGIRASAGGGSAGYDGGNAFRTWEPMYNDANFVLGGIWVFNSYQEASLRQPIYLQAGEFSTSVARSVLSFAGGHSDQTAAVNAIALFSSATFPTNSMATLYGIARV
jgi:hypothetical protein